MVSMHDMSRPITFPETGSKDDLESQKSWMNYFNKMMKYVYWIVGGGALFAVSYVLYNGNPPRCVASILIFVIGFLALYYYYVKWFFINDGLNRPTGQSLCPDYLTPVTPGFQRNFDGSLKKDQAKEFKCVDFVGVSTNGALRRTEQGQLQKALVTPEYHIVLTPDMNDEDIKKLLKAKGLTWVAMFSDDN
jgi:hypothetical protein